MNRTILTAFNNTLNMFIEELISSYPQEREFVLFKNTIALIRKANPKKILVLFNEYIEPYVVNIKDKNEVFFLNESYSDIVEENVKDTNNAWRFIDNLKQYWRKTSETNKDVIWKYLNTLITLSEKYK